MRSPPRLALFVNTGTALFMTGLVWYAQIVHYPLFPKVGSAFFGEYQLANIARTTLLVVPVMLVELATGVWLAKSRPPGVPAPLPYVALFLIILIWASTVLVFGPQHALLAVRFDPDLHARLLLYHWGRVGAWSLRSLLCLWMAAAAHE